MKRRSLDSKNSAFFISLKDENLEELEPKIETDGSNFRFKGIESEEESKTALDRIEEEVIEFNARKEEEERQENSTTTIKTGLTMDIYYNSLQRTIDFPFDFVDFSSDYELIINPNIVEPLPETLSVSDMWPIFIFACRLCRAQFIFKTGKQIGYTSASYENFTNFVAKIMYSIRESEEIVTNINNQNSMFRLESFRKRVNEKPITTEIPSSNSQDNINIPIEGDVFHSNLQDNITKWTFFKNVLLTKRLSILNDSLQNVNFFVDTGDAEVDSNNIHGNEINNKNFHDLFERFKKIFEIPDVKQEELWEIWSDNRSSTKLREVLKIQGTKIDVPYNIGIVSSIKASALTFLQNHILLYLKPLVNGDLTFLFPIDGVFYSVRFQIIRDDEFMLSKFSGIIYTEKRNNPGMSIYFHPEIRCMYYMNNTVDFAFPNSLPNSLNPPEDSIPLIYRKSFKSFLSSVCCFSEDIPF